MKPKNLLCIQLPVFIAVTLLLALPLKGYGKNEDLLTNIRETIHKNYNGVDFTDKDLTEGAAQGMVEKLNALEKNACQKKLSTTTASPQGEPQEEHTWKTFNELIEETSYKRLKESISGTFAGIGAVIKKDKDETEITVQKILEGSPAQRDGLLKNDSITAIDGKDVAALSLLECISLIRGKTGTIITLTISRQANKTRKEVRIAVKRGPITIPAVATRLLSEKTGGIQILNFSNETPLLMTKALGKLRSRGIDSLILDLRGNPGGEFSSAVKVADLFIPKGNLIVSTEKRGKKKHYKALRTPLWNGTTVCLVNRNTASAAEILAGALKSTGKAIIAGENTFGKDSIQTVFNLNNTLGLKLTTSKLIMRGIHNSGVIEPSVFLSSTACEQKSWISLGEDEIDLKSDKGISSAQSILSMMK